MTYVYAYDTFVQYSCIHIELWPVGSYSQGSLVSENAEWQFKGCEFAYQCWWGSPRYRHLAGLSLQIASAASDHHSINNRSQPVDKVHNHSTSPFSHEE